MAPKQKHPVIIVPAPLVEVYEALAWNKAVVDRAKATVAHAETLLAQSLTPGRRVEDPAAPRYVTARLVPAGTRRKSLPTARQTLIDNHPALAAACITTVIPTRRSAATFVRGGWLDYTAQLPALTVPIFTPRSPWAVVDFIAKGKETIALNGKTGDALRDQLDALLDEHTLRPAGTVLHECGRGRQFRVAPTQVTHRLNPAALEKADPALFLALTKPEAVPEKLELVMGEIETDAFDLSTLST